MTTLKVIEPNVDVQQLILDFCAEQYTEGEDDSKEEFVDEYIHEFRCSYTHETGLQPEYSRHYEAKEVARELYPGIWVGWTYWYGGGKHGEPECMPWLEDSYLLDVTTEMQPVHIFKKVEPLPKTKPETTFSVAESY
jgi:hypothetical protein